MTRHAKFKKKTELQLFWNKKITILKTLFQSNPKIMSIVCEEGTKYRYTVMDGTATVVFNAISVTRKAISIVTLT